MAPRLPTVMPWRFLAPLVKPRLRHPMPDTSVLRAAPRQTFRPVVWVHRSNQKAFLADACSRPAGQCPLYGMQYISCGAGYLRIASPLGLGPHGVTTATMHGHRRPVTQRSPGFIAVYDGLPTRHAARRSLPNVQNRNGAREDPPFGLIRAFVVENILVGDTIRTCRATTTGVRAECRSAVLTEPSAMPANPPRPCCPPPRAAHA
jgi:hypothetical protein